LLFPRKEDTFLETLENHVQKQKALFELAFNYNQIPSLDTIYSDSLVTNEFLAAILKHVDSQDKDVNESLTNIKRILPYLKDNKEYEKNFAKLRKAIEKESAEKIWKNDHQTIELSCGHKFKRNDLKVFMDKKRNIQKGPFVGICPICFQSEQITVLNHHELAEIYFESKKSEYIYQNQDISVEQCMICGCSQKDKISLLHSNHVICKQCLRKHVSKGELAMTKLDSKMECPYPNCKFRFAYKSETDPQTGKLTYAISFPFEYDRKEKISENPAMDIESIKFMKCEKCGTYVNRKEELLLKCKHYTCDTCIKERIENCCDSGISFIECKCPNKLCNKKIPLTKILAAVDNKSSKKIMQVFYKEGLLNKCYVCPNKDCLNKIFTENPKENLACNLCSKEFCTKCFKSRHEKGKCDYSNRKNYLEILNQEYGRLLENYKEMCNPLPLLYKPCPYCLKFIAIVDPLINKEKCQLQTIICSNCNKIFCADKSCKQEFIEKGGSSYHRPHCRFYPTENNDVQFKKTNMYPKPKDLNEYNDIPDEEK